MSRLLPPSSRRYVVILVPVLVLLVLAGCILHYSQPPAEPVATAQSESTTESMEPAEQDQDGTGILLGLAREAMRDGRLVAPQGSNAFEFYLSVLQLDPDNLTAQEALRESFSRAAEQIEFTINHNDLEEARRELDLLREFDPNNFTLSLLGGKLSAAWNLLAQQHEAEAQRIRRANLARGI